MLEIGFYVKKFISYFLEPFGMIIMLFLIALYYLFSNKNAYAKFYIVISFSLMLLFSYPPFSNFLIENLESQYPKYDYNHNVQYIHVLGSSHNDDKSQPLSSLVGRASIKRNIEGILIHLSMQNSKLIFTGYEGRTNISTAKMNAKLAIALGVNENNIIVNSLPKDTKEEALFAKEIIEDEPFILVTSASHMPRSMVLFKSLGLKPIAAPTHYYKENIDTYFMAPNLDSFRVSQVAVHEYIGIVWTKLKSLFQYFIFAR